MVSQNPHALQSTITSDMPTGITGTTAVPSSVPPVVYSLNQATAFNQTTTSYSLISHHQQYPEGHLSIATNLVPVHGVSQPIPIQSQSLYVEKTTNNQQFPVNASTDATSNQRSQPEVPPIDLPPKWKSAIDARGRRYYYHIKERISQWLPPPPDHIGVQPDSSSTSESSDDSTSSNEDEEDLDDEQIDKKEEDVYLDAAGGGTTEKRNNGKKVNPYNTPVGSALFPETKKRRDGLVQERIISVNISFIYPIISFPLLVDNDLSNYVNI